MDGGIEVPSVHVMNSKYRDAPGYRDDDNDEFGAAVDGKQHSLPSAEEVRAELAISKHEANQRRWQKNQTKRYVMVASFVMFLVVIFVTSATVAKNRGSSSSNSALVEKSLPQEDTHSTEVDDLPVDGAAVPTDDRWGQAVAFLSQGFASKAALEKKGTPQNLAAQWVANDDGYGASIPAKANDEDEDGFLQRYVLAVFYYSLTGDEWNFWFDFLEDTWECEWNMNIRHGANDDDAWYIGIECDDDGYVESIYMPSNNMAGELPSELGLLTRLTHMSFFSNMINGTLPDQLQHLTNMDMLVLEDNLLSGKVPQWLNQWTNLEYLNLGSNLLTGSVPPLDKLQYLAEVAMNDNHLSGGLGSFSGAASLEALFLQDNAMKDQLNTLNGVPSLKILDASNNLLGGYMPEPFYSIGIVDLHNNSIAGQIPDVSQPNYEITFLSLQGNKIGGPLPAHLGALEGLEHLDLSHNMLVGPLKDVFSGMTSLRILMVNDNNFQPGPIPNLMGVGTLSELSLSNTNRNGKIPEWMGSTLTDLKVLDLHGNSLTGPIPEALGGLVDLRILLLNRNAFSDTLPAALSSMQNLVMLYLDKNELSGDDSVICSNDGPSVLSYLVADCEPSFTCQCCSNCCDKEDMECNDVELTMSFDENYDRDLYIFSEDISIDPDA